MAKIPYRSAVGRIMYVMTYTRADIAYAVGQVTQETRASESEYGKHFGDARKEDGERL